MDAKNRYQTQALHYSRGTSYSLDALTGATGVILLRLVLHVTVWSSVIGGLLHLGGVL